MRYTIPPQIWQVDDKAIRCTKSTMKSRERHCKERKYRYAHFPYCKSCPSFSERRHCRFLLLEFLPFSSLLLPLAANTPVVSSPDYPIEESRNQVIRNIDIYRQTQLVQGPERTEERYRRDKQDAVFSSHRFSSLLFSSPDRNSKDQNQDQKCRRYMDGEKAVRSEQKPSGYVPC